jgi:hypothetical protein
VRTIGRSLDFTTITSTCGGGGGGGAEWLHADSTAMAASVAARRAGADFMQGLQGRGGVPAAIALGSLVIDRHAGQSERHACVAD